MDLADRLHLPVPGLERAEHRLEDDDVEGGVREIDRCRVEIRVCDKVGHPVLPVEGHGRLE
jgi:hypothetical protein